MSTVQLSSGKTVEFGCVQVREFLENIAILSEAERSQFVSVCMVRSFESEQLRCTRQPEFIKI